MIYHTSQMSSSFTFLDIGRYSLSTVGLCKIQWVTIWVLSPASWKRNKKKKQTSKKQCLPSPILDKFLEFPNRTNEKLYKFYYSYQYKINGFYLTFWAPFIIDFCAAIYSHILLLKQKLTSPRKPLAFRWAKCKGNETKISNDHVSADMCSKQPSSYTG